MAITFQLAGTVKEKVITELYIPTLRNSLVAGNFVTVKTDAKAKSIKIWGLGGVTSAAWTGGRLTATDHTNTSIDLDMNLGQSFSQDVHRVDTEASALDVLPGVLEAGAYDIANVIDTATFAMLATTTTSATGTFTALDASNIKEFFGAMAVALDNAGAPSVGRQIAVTPEIADLLSDVVGTLGSDSAATEAIRAGFVGTYKGFSVYKTVSLAAGTTGKLAIASVKTGAALGIGYTEVGIDPIPGSPVDNAWGATQYGLKLVKAAYVVKADVALA